MSMDFFQQAQDKLKQRSLHEALHYANAAERAGVNADECAALRWTCWMLNGEFEKAWEESDRIALFNRPDPHRYWKGGAWAGKRVLIRCLHGLGDTIQFIRYASPLGDMCRSLEVQTHPQLVTLLESVSGMDSVCSWDGRPEWEGDMEWTDLTRQ